ncbi:EcKinase 16 [Microplitis demolitor]|uniref:uncharacterized LOC103577607 n=1 Tax=Microplitis demolitor TaxID=69319 RepID=UPI0004CD9CEF|nr:uncharacterized LOC103577607 [Microplitis demolitor]KAG6558348.1 EcKinase 16 [Microplitis demolitor]
MMWEKRIKSLRSFLTEVISGELNIESYDPNELLAGENYQSKIISAVVKITKKKDIDQNDNLYIIVKMVPMNKDYLEISDLYLLFDKEIFMYKTILPAYKRFEIDSGFNESEVLEFAPLYYGGKLNPNAGGKWHEDDNTFIVLENLRTQGYYKIDRKTGADLDHSKLAIQAMAKFHSIGIAMKHKNPEGFELLKKKCTPATPKYPQNWVAVIKYIFQLIASDPMIQNYYDSCQKLYALELNNQEYVSSEPWSSIIHGDFTTLNILFHRYSNKTIPDDVKFVDFQNHTFTSPMRELACFLMTCTTQKVFHNHYDELRDLYYETLMNRLTLFGVDTELYSKESFITQYRYDVRSYFSYFITVPKILTLDFDINNKDVGDLPNLLINSPLKDEYRERLRDVILLYHNSGWFD